MLASLPKVTQLRKSGAREAASSGLQAGLCHCLTCCKLGAGHRLLLGLSFPICEMWFVSVFFPKEGSKQGRPCLLRTWAQIAPPGG